MFPFYFFFGVISPLIFILRKCVFVKVKYIIFQIDNKYMTILTNDTEYIKVLYIENLGLDENPVDIGYSVSLIFTLHAISFRCILVTIISMVFC